VNKRQSRWLVTGFLLALIGFCLFFTFGLSPYLQGAAERSDAFNLLGKCVAIDAADRLVVEQRGERVRVRLIGVEAPLQPGAAGLAEQAARKGVAPEWLGEQGRISRNTLTAWVYRRGLHLSYPFGEAAFDEEGRQWVTAEVAGIDLAYKLLQGGQVYATDTDHPQRALYQQMEAQARQNGVGIWRAGN
jgi:endonuclease YncB( thermonuclease family)